MKRVQLERFSIDNSTGNYRVFLGNGTARTFTSLRLTKAFLAKTNRYLSELLHETHQVYKDTWNAYQDNWFYFEHDKSSMNVHFYEKDRVCKRNLLMIDEKLNFITTRSMWANGHYFTFFHFKTIFIGFKETLKILIFLNKSRSNTNEIYRLRSIYRRVKVLGEDLQGYSEEDAMLLFDLPGDLSEKNETAFVPQLKVV